jgi:hypothetical protein
MAMSDRKRIPALVLAELDSCGLGWSLEEGSRHLKIKVAGRLAGVLPKGSGTVDARAVLNTRAQVRRLVSQLRP